jgi:hypothetical protein
MSSWHAPHVPGATQDPKTQTFGSAQSEREVQRRLQCALHSPSMHVAEDGHGVSSQEKCEVLSHA